MITMQQNDRIDAAAETLRGRIGHAFLAERPVGLVTGTGLAGLAEQLSEQTVPYTDIPFFPVPQSGAHRGQLCTGHIRGLPVIALQGRVHLYEGYGADTVVLPVRVLHALGVRTLILTNASGALNPLFQVGDIVCVTDQINLTGVSPLTGPNRDAWGERFPDMSRIFDRTLADTAHRAALGNSLRLQQGVYIGVHGPELESPAETRLYRMLGADCIGMSTVLEVIAARHLGMRILELSCITNRNMPDCMQETRIEEIIAAAERTESVLSALLSTIAGLLTSS